MVTRTTPRIACTNGGELGGDDERPQRAGRETVATVGGERPDTGGGVDDDQDPRHAAVPVEHRQAERWRSSPADLATEDEHHDVVVGDAGELALDRPGNGEVRRGEVLPPRRRW